ncbi:MAG: DUF2071 domain-containing protein [Bdellovibrionota bacterium]
MALRQTWENVVFLNYRGPASLVKECLPRGLELDLFEGEAVLSLVPFRMRRVRWRGLGSPGLWDSLWEFNLRTYVRAGSVRGIYFFTLEADHRLAVWAARTFFHLPYAHSKIAATTMGSHFDFYHRRGDGESSFKIDLGPEPLPENPLMEWATERYSLLAPHQDGFLRGDVEHARWALQSCDIIQSQPGLLGMIPGALESFRFAGAAWCPSLEVAFRPFRFLKPS